MRFSLPAVGIVFDLDVLEHGAHAIELFMKHTDPKRLAFCLIASGDVARPPSEIVNSRFDYCVAVSGHEEAVTYVRGVFLALEVPGLAPPTRRVIEQPTLNTLGLTEDGLVDGQGRLVTEEWYRIEHDRCKETGWGYAPRVVNYELSPELRAELDALQRPVGGDIEKSKREDNRPAQARTVSTPRTSESVASPSRIVDLRSSDFIQAQEEAASRGARVGDMHVGFKVIAVKDGALDHLSIVLAENVSARVSAKYVVWTLDRRPGGGYKSGTYINDRAEAQRAFDTRER